MNRWRVRHLSSRALLYGGALFLVLQAAFPFFWMMSTSFKPPREVFAQPPTFIPQDPTWENFHRLFTTTNFLIYFRNSMVVCGLTVLLTMAVSAAGAYSLTRYRYPGREKIAGLILCTYMFAPIMVVIPFFILVKKIGIENTHFALVLALTSFCLPFTLWLLRAFFQTIPIELEQAAMVDGAGRLRAVIYVVLPLALPGIIATSIFTFILAWNDYIFTRILIASDELKTLPVGVQDLFNSAIVDWGLIMGAGMMITIPALIFFVTVQRYLIRGWGAGADQRLTCQGTGGRPRCVSGSCSWVRDSMRGNGWRTLKAREDCEVVGLASRTRTPAEELQRDFGLSGATLFADWKEAISQGKADGVIITLPQMLHPEAAVLALKAGRHVLCEKPLAVDMAGARAVYDEARVRHPNLVRHGEPELPLASPCPGAPPRHP